MQIEELSKPLSTVHVKSRQQGGSSVSYIEAWHAIAEANRVFGFGGWDRQMVECRCVSERERAIGRQEKPGWGVTYTAKVRIAVRHEGQVVVREGTGAGHGIDVDCGQAHESAIKEAESDAMKRALMTFGNPFGLALYDKTKAQVEDPAQARAREDFEREVSNKLEAIKGIHRMDELVAFWRGLDRPVQADPRVIAAKDDRKMDLETQAELNASQEAAE